MCSGEWEEALGYTTFKVGNGSKIIFWTNSWCVNASLANRYAGLWQIAANMMATLADLFIEDGVGTDWNL